MIISETYKNRLLELSGLYFISESKKKKKSSAKTALPILTRPFSIIPSMEIGVIQEISPEEVEIPKKYIKDELNSKIWDGDFLKPIVKSQLFKIVRKFYEFLEIEVSIKDIKIVGSMANYNWSLKSDIDVHLFFDFKDINKDSKFVEEYLDVKKSLWKVKHNIKIYGFSVELYAQDYNHKFYSNGIYNLVKDEWEKKPSKEEFEVNKESLKHKIAYFINAIEKLEKNKDKSKPKATYDNAHNLKEKLSNMRQCGLESGGELSIENLTFKYLRNEGYIEKLFDLKREAFDKSMSLD